jgi:hypothetical protein
MAHQPRRGKRVDMALRPEDAAAMQHLQAASILYERYLELADVARIPSETEIEASSVPDPVNLPLTLVLNS